MRTFMFGYTCHVKNHECIRQNLSPGYCQKLILTTAPFAVNFKFIENEGVVVGRSPRL